MLKKQYTGIGHSKGEAVDNDGATRLIDLDVGLFMSCSVSVLDYK